MRLALRLVALVTLAASTQASPASAQSGAAGPKDARIERQTGVWVEGPGTTITYGGSYDVCAARCLADQRCVMLEYYRPEKKCNHYDTLRPRLKGGSSIVGIRR